MKITKRNNASVYFNQTLMGQLALTPEGLVGFAYDPSWLKNGFSISPYFLPLDNRLFVPKDFSFGGLFGVFNDSLPDSWGSFVTDSFLSKQGIQPDSLNPIERLCLLNSKSLGALIYGTGEKKGSANASLDLDSIKKECEVLIQKRDESSIDEIMAFGGSSGGANPKAHVHKDGKDWIVKFPTGGFAQGLAQMEYDYNAAALEAGIPVPHFELWKGKSGESYFASERFDRSEGRRIHMISLAGLYETSLEKGALDYGHLFHAVKDFTHDVEDLYDVFRRLYFNVYAGNEDDHAKNFAFLYDEKKKHYVLSPAYDLTLSFPRKSHGLSVAHNFNPEKEDVEKLADLFLLDPKRYKAIEEEVEMVVNRRLSAYLAKRN